MVVDIVIFFQEGPIIGLTKGELGLMLERSTSKVKANISNNLMNRDRGLSNETI